MSEVKKLGYFVNGKSEQSKTEKYYDISDPNTGEIFAKAPCCTKDEVNQAVESARKAFPGWSSIPVMKRVQIFYKFKRILEEHLNELTMLVCKENGKVWQEAKGDVLKAIEVVELACGAPTLMMGESLMDTSIQYDTVMYREPLGVFVGLVPWNFPAMIPFGWMVPLCIATGNTMVLKASSSTPGSMSVGKHIYSTAAAHGKRVQALCEAKNHCLVLEDAPIERTAAGIVNATYGCAGERCMALPVVVVQESIADELVAAIKKLAEQRVIGPSYDQKSELGPVVTETHKKFVLDWIEKGIEEGATLVLDGRNADFEEGIQLMNANQFANGSAIYTQNGYYSREFAKRTHAGMVGINVGIPVPVGIFPFSGHKNSFFGDLHVMGKDGIRFYTETKCVTTHWFDEEEMLQIKVDTWDGTIGKI
jgi:malonate-semialdehyde dehydrogenase (acetylating)/methylmalonate-semialdehyde dehydrogenase